MRVIKPSVEIITTIDGAEVLKHLEKVGRICYKSEDRITAESAVQFVAGIIKRGHEAVIEHFNITVKFVTDRGISHEIVRHRIASYAQESTRYCNYGKDKFDNQITVVEPINIANADDKAKDAWNEACEHAEASYFSLLDKGCTPQVARSVLPTCTKTEIMVTMNLREWRHFMKLRAAKTAHPDMRVLALDLLRQYKEKIPVVFDDIEFQDE